MREAARPTRPSTRPRGGGDDPDSSEEYTAEGGHGAVPTRAWRPERRAQAGSWPLYEVFVRGKRGLNHVHVGSLHAAGRRDGPAQRARPLHPPQRGRLDLGGAGADDITASSPAEKDPFFAPAGDKVYRHPTFYAIPEDVPHL